MTRIGLISYLEYACKFIHQWHTHTDNPYRKAMALIVISMSIFIASVFARSIFIQWIKHRIYDPCLCILYKPLIDFQFECHCPGWKEKWNTGSCNVQWISSTVYFFFFLPSFLCHQIFLIDAFSICDLISLKLCSLKVVLSISWTSSLLWKTFVFILMIFSHLIFLFHSNASILLNLFLLIGPHCWPL